jgi:integrative and conjugative element protein (TIGR02256 family)
MFRLRRSPRRLDGKRLFVPPDFFAAREREARFWAPDETGGMLLGYATDDGPQADVVVTDVLGAGPKAKRLRSRFEPDGSWQQERLERLYRSSGRTTTYLGDWHSHPTGGVRPSETDRNTYERVSKDRQSRRPHPVVVIIGLRRRRGRVAAYVFLAHELHEVELIVLEQSHELIGLQADRLR